MVKWSKMGLANQAYPGILPSSWAEHTGVARLCYVEGVWVKKCMAWMHGASVSMKWDERSFTSY